MRLGLDSAAPPSASLLRVKDLNAGYGDFPVLHGVNLEVRPGEAVALLGPNGHGKTTLLRTISGLHRASSGEIWFGDVEVSRELPNTIAGQGLVHVPQGDLLFPDMSVMENLRVGAYLNWRERSERLGVVWDVFPEIYARRDELARNLSGGERRMVAIGRGLMIRAKLMMVDEPSLGLAPIAIRNLYKALIELKEMSLPILLVEEAAERIGGFADRIYLLDSGRIVREGAADALLQDKAVLEAYLG